MAFSLLERENILREFGMGPEEERYVGALDERIRAHKLIKADGVSVEYAKINEEYLLEVELNVAHLNGDFLIPYKVTLYLEMVYEDETKTRHYFPKMEITKHTKHDGHDCEDMKYGGNLSDHHILAAKGYVEKKLAVIGKEYDIGKIKSLVNYWKIPIDLERVFDNAIDADSNERLRRIYGFAKKLWEQKQDDNAKENMPK